MNASARAVKLVRLLVFALFVDSEGWSCSLVVYTRYAGPSAKTCARAPRGFPCWITRSADVVLVT